MPVAMMPTVRGKRQQQKKMTRERLLRAAETVFTEKGFLEPSTIDIAKTAGTAHGTLFVHFPTRDDLVAEVISHSLGAMAARLHAEQKRRSSFDNLLDHLLEELAGYEKIYSRVLKEIDQLPSIARSTMLSIQSALSLQLYQGYSEQRETLHLKTIRQDQLFITWTGIVNHYILNRTLFAEGDSVLQERNNEIKQLFLSLLSKKG